MISQIQQSLQTEGHVGCQHDWMRIVFIIIDDEANDEDAAVGIVTAAVPDDAANRMCQISGDDDLWCDIYNWRGDDDVECTENHERAIWLLFDWYKEEQYACYFK